MNWVRRPIEWLRRHAIDPLERFWWSLGSDHKSVACAVVILVVIVVFEPSIPW